MGGGLPISSWGEAVSRLIKQSVLWWLLLSRRAKDSNKIELVYTEIQRILIEQEQ